MTSVPAFLVVPSDCGGFLLRGRARAEKGGLTGINIFKNWSCIAALQVLNLELQLAISLICTRERAAI